VFRKGGDVTFLVRELKAVFIPVAAIAAGREVHAFDHAELGHASRSTCRLGLMRKPQLDGTSRNSSNEAASSKHVPSKPTRSRSLTFLKAHNCAQMPQPR